MAHGVAGQVARHSLLAAAAAAVVLPAEEGAHRWGVDLVPFPGLS